MKQDSDPLCPLCGREEEDIHFTTRCMANSATISDGVVDLQEMYSEDGQDPPRRLLLKYAQPSWTVGATELILVQFLTLALLMHLLVMGEGIGELNTLIGWE